MDIYSPEQLNIAFKVRLQYIHIHIHIYIFLLLTFNSQDAVNAATVMGARIRKSPPFREGSILKFKRSLVNLNNIPLPPSNRNGNSQQSKRGPGFMDSWPESIVLKSAEQSVRWSALVTGKCCPFCAPAGRCRTLKELRDHLSTHHPDFTYKAVKNGPDGAVITVCVCIFLFLFHIHITCF